VETVDEVEREGVRFAAAPIAPVDRVEALERVEGRVVRTTRPLAVLLLEPESLEADGVGRGGAVRELLVELLVNKVVLEEDELPREDELLGEYGLNPSNIDPKDDTEDGLEARLDDELVLEELPDTGT
jgi:hypothetical protein